MKACFYYCFKETAAEEGYFFHTKPTLLGDPSDYKSKSKSKN